MFGKLRDVFMSSGESEKMTLCGLRIGVHFHFSVWLRSAVPADDSEQSINLMISLDCVVSLCIFPVVIFRIYFYLTAWTQLFSVSTVCLTALEIDFLPSFYTPVQSIFMSVLFVVCLGLSGCFSPGLLISKRFIHEALVCPLSILPACQPAAGISYWLLA